jgi:hypothetical protein
VEPAIELLRSDLESGRWQERHQELLAKESIDYGFRILIAGS